MDKIKFQNDDDEQYEPTDSEEEYSEEERELLQEVRKGRQRNESKQREVLAFTESEDEDEDEEEDDDNEQAGEDDEDDDDDDEMGLADSDIEGAEVNEDDLPDTKYWGKKTSAYYNTDFVDQDYSSYNEKEEELAKLEEEEAKAIQLRLSKQLKEEDFTLDSTFSKLKKSKKGDTEPEEKSLKGKLLKADFSGLSKRERLELFEKDSPEFAGLIGDFEGYLEEIQQLHAPVLRHVQDKNLNMIPALQFAQHYQNIALTYCSNLAFYLLLKAKRISIENHPIIQRLTQLKKLLKQLEDKHENIIKPQLEALLERIQDGDEFEILDMKNVPPPPGEQEKPKKRKVQQSKLGILSAYDEQDDDKEEGPSKKKTKVDVNADKDLATLAEMSSGDDDDDDDDDEEEAMGEEEEGEDENGETRRGITYQIAKNKGLMPHRKKEQRNPRVKHRGKYRKALIRRKGAVRTVRKETSRYGGEISGIKATVSKSIKFRT